MHLQRALKRSGRLCRPGAHCRIPGALVAAHQEPRRRRQSTILRSWTPSQAFSPSPSPPHLRHPLPLHGLPTGCCVTPRESVDTVRRVFFAVVRHLPLSPPQPRPPPSSSMTSMGTTHPCCGPSSTHSHPRGPQHPKNDTERRPGARSPRVTSMSPSRRC